LAGENFTQSFARHGDLQPDWRPPDFAAPLGEAETSKCIDLHRRCNEGAPLGAFRGVQ